VLRYRLAEEHICTESMCIVPVKATRYTFVCSICESEKVELLLASMSRDIDWQENRPCEHNSNAASGNCNLEMPEEEISI
jgi:hypothetical protein